MILIFIFIFYFLKGIFSSFVFFIQHCIICRLSDSIVSEDAEIEPRTIATLALAIRRSNTRLDIISFFRLTLGIVSE
jgi:hypothetical protein